MTLTLISAAWVLQLVARLPAGQLRQQGGERARPEQPQLPGQGSTSGKVQARQRCDARTLRDALAPAHAGLDKPPEHREHLQRDRNVSALYGFYITYFFGN